ncbi:MAG: peptidoglycan-associated lipoprotein Pal [Candidatus Rokubacteria bacterium]|nr:peptidoglycan-associated lipoprotein Pal [Candidatus Rokubacteria bacterium]MBI3826000.1 peptidoglycan-associated lipoprotein Pal [Candidatus Rokubacteria bacterium]
MVTRWRSAFILSLLLTTVVFAGCAKRPATTAVSAPPPTTAAAVAATPSAPAAAALAPAAPAPAPAPATAAAPTGTRPKPSDFMANENLKDIHFDFDKYDIRPGDAKILDADAGWLKSNDMLVLIEGHCDERGTNEYNLALGERRAKATMNYLVSQGVQANRITIISYGEERPLCTEHNESCWAKNRRSHFLVKAR